MHESGCNDDTDSQARLARRQPKAWRDMRLAGAAVSHRDDVLVAEDVITACPFPHQDFVQREHGLDVKAVEAFDGGKLRSPDRPFHHTALTAFVSGAFNQAAILQSGDANTAWREQNGSGNLALISQ